MKTKAGFTLIEVLVALVILAGGLLGFAALQSVSLKKSLSAYNSGQASQLAYNLADRMRANVADAKLATDSNPLTVSAYLGAPAEKKNCTATAGCTPTEMAQNDLFEWQQEIIDALGARSSGTVSYTIATGFFNVAITWDDNRDGDVDGHIGPRNGDTDGDGDTDDDPMYQMTFKL